MRRRFRALHRLAALVICIWMLSAVSAFADSVRVTRDKSTIWRADAPSVTLTVVAAGTILEVVDRQGVWVRVRLPRSVGDPAILGLILASSVEPVPGGSGQPTQPPGRGAQVRPAPEPFVIRAFGEIGYTRFTATESFKAIFDKDSAWVPGAGVDAIWPNGSFVSAEVEWFRLKGERAFVLNDQVFRLGIEDVVTAVPISMTVGYQFGRSTTARPYAGAGFGVLLFKEEADFAESGDDVSEHFASFHVTGGVDLLRRHRVSTAVEARYNWVRDAIGKGGVSQDFNEKDLGGFTLKVKVLFH
jgi:hypothetical protein